MAESGQQHDLLIKKLTSKKRGRPFLLRDELDQHVQEYMYMKDLR